MTRLTALIIRNPDNEIYGDFYGPIDGKYGLAVVFDDKTPSGCSRPRVLLESGPVYETPESAKDQAEEIIKKTREMTEDLLYA
jgi:hypothetical protein